MIWTSYSLGLRFVFSLTSRWNLMIDRHLRRMLALVTVNSVKSVRSAMTLECTLCMIT